MGARFIALLFRRFINVQIMFILWFNVDKLENKLYTVRFMWIRIKIYLYSITLLICLSLLKHGYFTEPVKWEIADKNVQTYLIFYLEKYLVSWDPIEIITPYSVYNLVNIYILDQEHKGSLY